MLTLARRLNDPALLLQAHRALTETFFWTGEFLTAREHGEQGIALYMTPAASQPCCALRGGAGRLLLCDHRVGAVVSRLPRAGVKKEHRHLLLARQGSHPFSEAMALTLATQVLLAPRGNPCSPEHMQKRELRSLRPKDFHFGRHGKRYCMVGLRAQLGQGKEGTAEIHKALAVYPAVEFRTWNLALLAEASVKAGAIDEGLQVLMEALAMVEQTGERFYEGGVVSAQRRTALKCRR